MEILIALTQGLTALNASQIVSLPCHIIVSVKSTMARVRESGEGEGGVPTALSVNIF